MGGEMINSRRKGHSFERDLCRVLRSVFPDIERSLEGSMADQNGVDLMNTGNLAIQAKRGRKYAPLNKIEEVKSDKIAVLITRGDQKKAMACLYLEDFLKIIQDIGEVYYEDRTINGPRQERAVNEQSELPNS